MIGTLEQRMSVAYSTDLRVRVIEAVKAGASRREAAECFGISVSSGIRWLREWLDGAGRRRSRRGVSCSPLEEHATWLLALIEKRPDLTLEEVVTALGKSEQNRADVARARRRWLRQQHLLDSTALVFLDETAITTNMVRTGHAARAAIDWSTTRRTDIGRPLPSSQACATTKWSLPSSSRGR